jgi:hypothetical protein
MLVVEFKFSFGSCFQFIVESRSFKLVTALGFNRFSDDQITLSPFCIASLVGLMVLLSSVF